MPSVSDAFPELFSQDDSLTPREVQTDASPTLINFGNALGRGIASAVQSLPGAPRAIDRAFPEITPQKPNPTDFLDDAVRADRFTNYSKGVIGNEYSPYRYEQLGDTPDNFYDAAVENAKTKWKSLYPDTPWGATQDNYIRQKALAYDMAHRFATTGDRGQMQMRGAIGRMNDEQRALFEQSLQEVASWQKETKTDRMGNVGAQQSNDTFMGQAAERLDKSIVRGIQDNWNAWGDSKSKETGYQLAKNRRVTDAAQPQAGPNVTGHKTWGEFSSNALRSGALAAVSQIPDLALSTSAMAASNAVLPGSGQLTGMAYWYNRLYPEAYATMRDAGFKPGTAEATAHGTAVINGAIEMFNDIVPVPGMDDPTNKVIAKTWREWIKNNAIDIGKRFGKEWGEEAAQAVTEEAVKRVAQAIEPDVPLDAREQLGKIATQVVEAGLTLPWMAAGGNAQGLAQSAAQTQAKISADKTRLGRQQGVNDLVTSTDYVQGWMQRSPEQAAAMAQTDTPSRSQWEAAGLPKGVSGTQRKAFADAVRSGMGVKSSEPDQRVVGAFKGYDVKKIDLKFADTGAVVDAHMVTLPNGKRIVIDSNRDTIVFDEDKIAADYGVDVSRVKGAKARGKYRPADGVGLIELLRDFDAGTLSHEKLHALFDLAYTEDQKKSILATYKTEERAAEAYRRQTVGGRGIGDKLLSLVEKLRTVAFGTKFPDLNGTLQSGQNPATDVPETNFGNMPQDAAATPVAQAPPEAAPPNPATTGQVTAPVANTQSSKQLPVSPESDLSNVSEWMRDDINQRYAIQKRNGNAAKIEDLSAQGNTSKQIAQMLGIDIEDVGSVRAKLGIPSMNSGGMMGGGTGPQLSDEFKAWRDNYNSRKGQPADPRWKTKAQYQAEQAAEREQAAAAAAADTAPLAGDPTPQDVAETAPDIQMGPVQDATQAKAAPKTYTEAIEMSRQSFEDTYSPLTRGEEIAKANGKVSRKMLVDAGYSDGDALRTINWLRKNKIVSDSQAMDGSHQYIGETQKATQEPAAATEQPPAQPPPTKLGKRLTDPEIAAIRAEERRKALTAAKNEPTPNEADLVPPKPVTLGNSKTSELDLRPGDVKLIEEPPPAAPQPPPVKLGKKADTQADRSEESGLEQQLKATRAEEPKNIEALADQASRENAIKAKLDSVRAKIHDANAATSDLPEDKKAALATLRDAYKKQNKREPSSDEMNLFSPDRNEESLKRAMWTLNDRERYFTVYNTRLSREELDPIIAAKKVIDTEIKVKASSQSTAPATHTAPQPPVTLGKKAETVEKPPATFPKAKKPPKPSKAKPRDTRTARPWRELLDETDDVFGKSDILRTVANHNKVDSDLREVVDRIRSLTFEGEPLGEGMNTAWGVMQNPSASAETKAAASEVRDYIQSRMDESIDESNTDADSAIKPGRIATRQVKPQPLGQGPKVVKLGKPLTPKTAQDTMQKKEPDMQPEDTTTVVQEEKTSDKQTQNRHTPAAGTPEREAIETAYREHKANMDRLAAEYETQDAIRKKFKPSTKKFQTADDKIDQINREISQAQTDNAKTIFTWRAATEEDNAASAADEGNRLGFESIAATGLRDAGLISRDKKDEIQTNAYNEVRKLVAQEAKKQGVPEANIERVVNDIVPFVISYPSQKPRDTIENRVSIRAKTVAQDNIYDKAVEHVSDLEHLESSRKREIKRELEKWKDDSDKVKNIAAEATAENLREKKNKEKVEELSRDTNIARTKSLTSLDGVRTGPAVVLFTNHAGADHKLVTNKKWMIDTTALSAAQAKALKDRQQGVVISDKMLEGAWEDFGGNKSKSSLDKLDFAGVRETTVYDKSKKKDVPYSSAIFIDEAGNVLQVDAALPAYLSKYTSVDSVYALDRGKNKPSGVVFFAGDKVIAVSLADRGDTNENAIDIPTARKGIKELVVSKTKLGKAAQAARAEADAAQAQFEADAQAAPQPAAFAAIPSPPPPRPRRDDIPAAVQADNPEVERQLAESSGVTKDGVIKKFVEAVPLAFKLATRAQEFIPNTPKWAADNEAFRLLKTISNISQDEANRDIAAITDKLGPQPLQLFSRKIVIDNLYESVQRGEPLRFGFDSIEEVKQYKDKLDDLAERSPEVKDAIDTRKRIVKELAQKLVDMGLLDEKAIERADTYYHQQVLSKFEASRNHAGAGPKETKRGFQKRRVEGVEKFDEKLNYNTSYIEAEFEWMRDAHAQLRLEQWIRDLAKRHDIIEDVKKAAKDSGEDWRRMVRESGTHKIWQAEPGNVFYPAVGVDEQIVADVLAGIADTAEIGMDDLRSLIVLGGKRREMVLPNEIVDQLNAVQARSKIGQIGKVIRDIGNYWKVWTLLNPIKAAGYNLRNITGDIDPVMGGAIGVLQPKYFGKSFNELRDYYGILKQQKLSLSPELQTARDLGVIDSSMTSDIPDLEDLEVFKRFYTGQSKSLLDYGKLYFDKIKKYSTFRENLSRYAAFLYYRDALKEGTLAHYGGARKAIVDQLVKEMGVDVAAAHLSRNLLGDYGDLTVMGNWLRAYAMPFYSWTEVNLKRYPRIIYNAGMYGPRKFGKSPAAVAASVAAAGMVAVPYIIMQAYNNLVWGDEEDKLSDDERASPHLILGKNDDGSLIILRNTGALGDFLEWFGVNMAVSRLDEINAGQMGYGDVIAESAKQDVNKVASGIRPDIKAFYEMSSGNSTFPDVFNPRKQRRDDMAAGYLGLTDYYRGLRGAVLQDGSRMRKYQVERMLGVTDPRRNALFEISELRDRYLKKLGQSGGFMPNLYFANMRDAAMNGDVEAFKEARTKWLTDGDSPGDYEKFKERLKGLDPLSEKMNDEKENDFVDNYLTAAQRDKLRMARDYAGQMQVEMWKMWNQSALDDTGEVKAKINEQRVKEATSKARTLLANDEPKTLSATDKKEGITLGVKKQAIRDAAAEARDWIKDSGLDKAEVEDAVWAWIKDDLSTDKGRLAKMRQFQKKMGWSEWTRGK